MITIPVGTSRWHTQIHITKGITLSGQTTIANAGAANAAASDLSIVTDEITDRTAGLIKIDLAPTKTFRLTGITFRRGATYTTAKSEAAITLNGSGTAPTTNVRVDHCHFDNLLQASMLTTGWLYGVADHNLFDATIKRSFFLIGRMPGYGARPNGDGAFADFPWFGTDKFFFLETNTILGDGAGITDSKGGGRWVVRKNYVLNGQPTTHGTEGDGAVRGVRAVEVYDNKFVWNNGNIVAMFLRSGTTIWHDNDFTGTSTSGACITLETFRMFNKASNWNGATGWNPWDKNDTEGNNTYVAGHPPFIYATGTASSANTAPNQNSSTVQINISPAPAANQWASSPGSVFVISNANPSSPSYYIGGMILSNTATSITYNIYGSADRKRLDFAAGDALKVARVIQVLDQAGVGKGDLKGATPAFLNQQIEPVITWNNNNGTGQLGAGNFGQNIALAGVHFVNLGGGKPVDIIPPEVRSKYPAAVNGTDFTSEYIYPHPLTQ